MRIAHQHQLHVIKRVRGMRRTIGFTVKGHLLGIAVVGGDDGAAALLGDGFEDLSNADIDRFARLDGRGEVAGVADHVAVGEVDHDQAVRAGFNAFDRLSRHFGGGHFGLLVISRHILWTLHDLPLFAIERFIAIIVEKEGDVRILLRLGAAELAHATPADEVGENVDHLRRLGESHAHRQAGLIRGHRDVMQIELRATVKAVVGVELVEHEGLGQLARAVAAVVVENDRIAIGHARVPCFADGARGDELIPLAIRIIVVIVKILHRVGGGGEIGKRHVIAQLARQQVVCLLDPVPAVVAIHCVVPADDAGDLPHADLPAFGLHLLQVTLPTERRRVPAVGEGVNQHPLHALLLCDVEDTIKVFEQSMHAGVADDAEQMQLRLVFPGMPTGADERLIFTEPAHADEAGDAHRFLVDDAPRPDVLVADLAVAHRLIRQADVHAAGVNQRGRILGRNAISDGRACQLDGIDGIMLGVGIAPPAITDDQDNGPVIAHKQI